MARITQKQAAQQDAGGFDTNPNENFGEDLPEGMGIPPEESVAESKAGKYEYKPSAKTLEKLNAMPKEDLFKEFGISLDDRATVNSSTGEQRVHKGLISSTREYGVLEDLAEGRYTRKPIRVIERLGHKRVAPYYALVKFMPASADGKYDWNLETRKVDLKYKLDENGNRLRDEYGKYVLTYDKKEVRRDQIIQIGNGRNAQDLTPEQHDMVRLLGVIEGVIPNENLVNQVWVANEYDPTVLVAVNSNYILSSLEGRLDPSTKKGQGSIWIGKERQNFTFGEREAKLWAQGKGAYVRNEKGENKFVRYDPLKNRFGVSVTLDVALQKDRAREKARKDAMSKRPAQAKEQGEAQGRKI